MTDQQTTYPGKELEALSVAVNYHRWIVSRIAPYLGDTVAEVGAGVGSVSLLLLENNVGRLVAFEPSNNMYPLLAENLAHENRAVPVNDFFSGRHAPQGFDSVIYINVLEHIDDDRAELGRAFDALKPGGHLVLFVPALAWLYSDFDGQIGHFRRYTRSGLSGLVGDVGFTVLEARYFDVAGIIPWYLYFVLLRKSIGAGSVSLYDKVVVPVMRVVERVVPPPVGKNVLLIARKKMSPPHGTEGETRPAVADDP